MFNQDELINNPEFQGLSKQDQDTVLSKYTQQASLSPEQSAAPAGGLSWDTISASPEFKALSPSDRQKVSQKYQTQSAGYGANRNTAPRSAVGEIFTGLKKGALTAESMAGQSLQYLSSPGNPTYETGTKLVESARETEAQNPERYQTRPKQHGAVVNALTAGAEMIVPSMGPSLAAGAAIAAAPIEIPALAAAGLASLASVVPFALSQGQQSYENVKKAGGTEEQATRAGRINAFIEGAGEEVAGLFELRFLGKALKIFGAGKVIGETAENVLGKIAKPKAMREFLKDALRTQAIEVGTEFGQNYGEAKVEKAYGVKSSQTPFQAGLSVIPATVGMGILLLPFGGLSAAKNFSENRKIVNALQDPEAPEGDRLIAATYVASQIKPVDKQAASTWAAAAAQAIEGKEPINLGKPIAQTMQEVRKTALEKTRTQASDTDLKVLKGNPATLAKYGLTVKDIEAIQLERMGPVSKAVKTVGANVEQGLNAAQNELSTRNLMNDMASSQEAVQGQENAKVRKNRFAGLKEQMRAKQESLRTKNDNQSQERMGGAKYGGEELGRTVPVGKEGKGKVGAGGNVQKNVTTPQVATEGLQKPTEKRVDLARRKAVNEMTPGEMKKALLTDHLTGLRNRRAYDEAENYKPMHTVFLDADSLKFVNDNMGGHPAGDEVLKAIGNSIKQHTEEGYRISGDEFIVRTKNAEEAMRVVNKINKTLEETRITYRVGDKTYLFKPEASYGIAETAQEADQRMLEHKKEKKAAGLRAGRGGKPKNLVEVAPEGRKIESVPEKLSKAVGKPGQVETLKQGGITGEKQQIQQIVNDSVKQKVDLAAQLHKAGHTEIAAKYRADAEENGKKLKAADGVVTEKAVDAALGNGKVSLAEQPFLVSASRHGNTIYMSFDAVHDVPTVDMIKAFLKSANTNAKISVVKYKGDLASATSGVVKFRVDIHDAELSDESTKKIYNNIFGTDKTISEKSDIAKNISYGERFKTVINHGIKKEINSKEKGTEKAIARQKTYDEIQKEIDDKTTKLMKSGKTLKEADSSPEIKALYEKRDAIGNQELTKSYKEIKERINSILHDDQLTSDILRKYYSLDPKSQLAQHFASEYTVKSVKETETAVKGITRELIAKEKGMPPHDIDLLFGNNSPLTDKGKTDLLQRNEKLARKINNSIKEYLGLPVDEAAAKAIQPAIKVLETKGTKGTNAEEKQQARQAQEKTEKTTAEKSPSLGEKLKAEADQRYGRSLGRNNKLSAKLTSSGEKVSNPADIHAELESKHGAAVVSALEKKGFLNIVESDEAQRLLKEAGIKKSLKIKGGGEFLEVKIGKNVVPVWISPNEQQLNAMYTKYSGRKGGLRCITDKKTGEVYVFPAALSMHIQLIKGLRGPWFEYSRYHWNDETTPVDEISYEIKKYRKQYEEFSNSDIKLSADGKRIEGFIHNGKAYLINGNIEKGQAATVFAHELGSHLYLENTFTGKNWDSIINSFKALENTGTNTGQAIRKAIAMIPADTPAGNYESEKIAYYIGDQANQRQTLYRRILAHIKNALVKIGVPAGILKPADLAVIAESGIRRMANADYAATGEQSTKMSKSSGINKAIEKIIAPVYYDPVAGTIDTAMINLSKAKVFAKDFSVFDTIFRTAEHYYYKIPAAHRYLDIVLNRRDKFEHMRNNIIGDFPEFGKKLKKTALLRYNFLSNYLDKHDKFQYGYKIKYADDKFIVEPPKKSLLFKYPESGLKLEKSFNTEQEAVDFMIRQEASDYMKSNPDATKEEVALMMDTRRATNEGFNLLSQQLRDRIAKAKQDGQKMPTVTIRDKKGESKQVNLREVLDEIGDLRGSYMPRIRKRGSYSLIAERKNKNGEIEHYSQNYDAYLRNYSTDSNAKAILKNVFNKTTPIARKARELEADGYTIKSIKLNSAMPEELFNAANLVTAVENMIKTGVQRAEGVEGSILGSELDKAVNESIADMFRMRGFRSVMMKRNSLLGASVYKGYETDLIKRVVQYSNNTAAGIAKRDMARGMVMAITGRDKTWAEFKRKYPNKKYSDYQEFVRKRGIDPVKQPTAYADIMSHMNEMLRNDDAVDRIVSTAKGLACLKYLGFRVSSGFINVTNMVMNVPAAMVAIGHIPYAKSFRLIGQGMKDYSKWRTGQGKISEENKAALDYIHEQNWDEALFNKDAYTSLLSKLEGKWHNFTAWSMWVFGETERLNRGSTILAAYNGIKPTNGWGGVGIDEKRMSLAHEVSDMAHGIYDKGTRPAVTRGSGLGPAAMRASYTFMKFQHNFLQLLGAVSPTGHLKSKVAFAHMLISPAIIGGAGASLLLPVLTEMAKALGIGGDDPEEAFYKWAGDTFNGADFARFGIPGLAGVSIKGSLAINGPPTTLEGILGAPYSVFADEYKAASLLGRGDFMKAAEKALPTGLGAPIRAYREATEGVTSKSNLPLFYGAKAVYDSPAEAMWRVFGFAPKRISKIREQQWNEKVVMRKYSARKKEIYNQYRKVLLDGGNASELGKVFKEIESFNLDVMHSGRPDIRMITRGGLSAALRRFYIPPKRELLRSVNQ